MGISPAHINGMAEGIDRVTLRKGRGYTFKQTSGGTALNITEDNETHPWRARSDGVNIFIDVGRIWGNGIIDHPNSTLMYGMGYTANDVYFGGKTLFVDIANSTVVSSDSVNDSTTGKTILAVPAVKGYYYIQYVLWNGSTKGGTDDTASTKAKGTKQFVLKHLPLSGVLPKTNVYPVCELQDDGLLVQGMTSDIWYAPQIQTHPFQIYITDYEGDAYAEVAMGTLCNIEAEYSDGLELGDPDGGEYLGKTGSLGSVNKYFYITAKTGTRGGAPVFPSSSEGVVLRVGSSIPRSSDTVAYVGIGRIISREGEPVIEQFVTGSLWGEYFKLGSKPALFWFSRI